MIDVKDVLIDQPMPGRNCCKSADSRVCPRFHERLLLIIWYCACDPRIAYPKYRVSCVKPCQMSSFGYSIKQNHESPR